MTSPLAPGQYVPASQAMLASRTSEAIGRNPDRRTGVVSAIDSGVLTVEVAGGATERVGYLASYEPAVGDVVALIQQRSTWLCIGRLVASDGGDGGALPGVLLGGVLFSTPGTTTLTTGAEAAVTGYVFTVTLPADRLVEIRATYIVDNNTSDLDFPFMRLRENSLAGPQIYGAYSLIGQGHVGVVQHVEYWMRTPATVETKTYVLTAQRTFGAATINISRYGIFGAIDHGRSTNVTVL